MIHNTLLNKLCHISVLYREFNMVYLRYIIGVFQLLKGTVLYELFYVKLSFKTNMEIHGGICLNISSYSPDIL